MAASCSLIGMRGMRPAGGYGGDHQKFDEVGVRVLGAEFAEGNVAAVVLRSRAAKGAAKGAVQFLSDRVSNHSLAHCWATARDSRRASTASDFFFASKLCRSGMSVPGLSFCGSRSQWRIQPPWAGFCG